MVPRNNPDMVINQPQWGQKHYFKIKPPNDGLSSLASPPPPPTREEVVGGVHKL